MAPKARTDPRSVGEEALARSDWETARGHFEAALRGDPDDPRALDGLAFALFWLGDMETPTGLRERAYVEHRARGDGRRAAAAAAFVAGDYRIMGNAAAAGGWLARADRCLEGVELCAEHGTIELERGKAMAEFEQAEPHVRRALEIARHVGDPDLEITALAQLGVRLVGAGRWNDGVALLDEAMAAAMGGEARDALAICDTCCQTLVACDQMADVRRAAEWCRVVVEFAQRRNFTPVSAWCRAIYAGVLTATGDWERAERELVASLQTYDRVGGIGHRLLALARLAELRLRQGRPEEAARLLAGCEDHPLAVLPLARLRLIEGDAATAAALLERRLAGLPGDAAATGPLLGALAEVRIARRDFRQAEGDIERLAKLARALARDNLRALAALHSGELALASGEGDPIAVLEDAAELFRALGMPYEEGVARLRLGQAFVGRHPELAVEEGRNALRRFQDLGAARRADEVVAFLRSIGAPARKLGSPQGELTSREREVLGLLGEGLSNAEIAKRLVISEKTAGHHVSRILRKLGVRNRTEAAAQALRDGPAG